MIQEAVLQKGALKAVASSQWQNTLVCSIQPNVSVVVIMINTEKEPKNHVIWSATGIGQENAVVIGEIQFIEQVFHLKVQVFLSILDT